MSRAWGSICGFLSDFASLRLMTRIEFDPRVCWPRFHHVADATRSPDGRHVRASPRANVPLVRRMCLVLPVPATCYFPRLGSPPPLTSRATDIFRKTIATPPPWRCFVGLAERIFSVGCVHVFHFLRGCPDLGWWQGGRRLESAGAIFLGKNCDPHGGFKKMKNWLSHFARRLR